MGALNAPSNFRETNCLLRSLPCMRWIHVSQHDLIEAVGASGSNGLRRPGGGAPNATKCDILWPPRKMRFFDSATVYSLNFPTWVRSKANGVHAATCWRAETSICARTEAASACGAPWSAPPSSCGTKSVTVEAVCTNPDEMRIRVTAEFRVS